MQCLFDADVLKYEIGFAAEASWKYLLGEGWDGSPPPWDVAEKILQERISHVEYQCEATEPSLMFFTGKTNFRNDIAKRQPYKERAGHKPFHYANIEVYLRCNFECRQQEGLEADDLISIEQTSRLELRETIICTRDKDLRQVSGWHYGWELGKQPSFGPYFVSDYGAIHLSSDRKKVTGWGLKFFLSQCLTGDSVDSIPGLPKCGPVASYELLHDTTSYDEGRDVVFDAYENKYGVDWESELTEQGRLLWMTRELNPDGTPQLWSPYIDYEKL